MSIQPWQLKRIKIELGDMSNSDHTLMYDEGNVTIWFQYGGKYKVKISDLSRYPFHPPQMNINGSNLSYSPALFPRRLYEEHTKKYKNACPCCVSVYCADNWSPSLGIKDIIQEYIGFVEKLKTYQKIKILRGIHLPDDMINEIISFLL